MGEPFFVQSLITCFVPPLILPPSHLTSPSPQGTVKRPRASSAPFHHNSLRPGTAVLSMHHRSPSAVPTSPSRRQLRDAQQGEAQAGGLKDGNQHGRSSDQRPTDLPSALKPKVQQILAYACRRCVCVCVHCLFLAVVVV